MNTYHANIDELAADLNAAGIRLERPAERFSGIRKSRQHCCRPAELTWTGQPLIARHMACGRSAVRAICS